MKTVEKLLLVRVAMLQPERLAALGEAATKLLAELLAKGKEESYGVSPLAWSEEDGISHKVFTLSLTGLEEIKAAREACDQTALNLCLVNVEDGGKFTVNRLPDKHKSIDEALASIGLRVNSLT